MPSKILGTTTEPKPKGKKIPAMVETRKKKRDPWLTRDAIPEQRGGRNWLPKEKSRDWLKGR